MAKIKIKSRGKKKTQRRKNKSKCDKKSIGFTKAVGKIKKHVLKGKPKTFGDAIKIAQQSAKCMSKKIKPTRAIKIPKTGGILPLLPIFAGLSALGTISGGAAVIAKTVNDTRSAKQKLEEAKGHNRRIEEIAVGGKGLYLRPYKTGYGLFYILPIKKLLDDLPKRRLSNIDLIQNN